MHSRPKTRGLAAAEGEFGGGEDFRFELVLWRPGCRDDELSFDGQQDHAGALQVSVRLDGCMFEDGVRIG